MTLIKKVINYIFTTPQKLWYDVKNKGRGDIKMNNNDKLDARTLACYIKEYYKVKFSNEEISPIKLQKALYFCFAYWGGFIRKNNSFSDETKEVTFNYDEILFPNSIEAWVYGPVVPDVYHEKNLDKYKEKDTFNGEKYMEEFINNVLDDVLSANDFKLVDVSHQDKCWQRNFKPKSKFHNCVIPPEEIISEYVQ